MIAVILALFIRTWVVQAFKIPTGSMENNLLVGDHLLVNKLVFAPTMTRARAAMLPVREIRRGDIIVFKYPEEPERDFIKRVIGLPGETLELRHKKVYINGAPLDEDYVQFPRRSGDRRAIDDARDDYGPVTVPAGYYFMMGDNRDNSRTAATGASCRADYIKGKALMIYWSFEPERHGRRLRGHLDALEPAAAPDQVGSEAEVQ